MLTQEVAVLCVITGYTYYACKWNQKSRNKVDLQFPHKLIKCGVVYEKKCTSFLKQCLLETIIEKG